MLVWIKEGSFNTCLNGSVNEIFEKLSYHFGFLSPPLKDMQKKNGIPQVLQSESRAGCCKPYAEWVVRRLA